MHIPVHLDLVAGTDLFFEGVFSMICSSFGRFNLST